MSWNDVENPGRRLCIVITRFYKTLKTSHFEKNERSQCTSLRECEGGWFLTTENPCRASSTRRNILALLVTSFTTCSWGNAKKICFLTTKNPDSSDPIRRRLFLVVACEVLSAGRHCNRRRNWKGTSSLVLKEIPGLSSLLVSVGRWNFRISRNMSGPNVHPWGNAKGIGFWPWKTLIETLQWVGKPGKVVFNAVKAF